ncbi:MAG: SurA N-terminal domain-containing protein [Candidatus Aureabacteria bacterium]|nr:SurA N-terminal domain-containing protein [Candidatus Auribacterota bacterium]
MKTNIKTKCFFTILVVILSGMIFYGFGCDSAGPGSEDESVVARINDYDLTVSDFKNEADFTLSQKDILSNPLEAKERLLESLITKNILLQEAQKQNFDKDREFMKEIEGYWKQALLKLILKYKSNELFRDICVEDAEVLYEYKRMRRKILAGIIILNDKSSADRLSKSGDNFEEVKNSMEKNIVSDEPSGWWILGDLPQSLEDPLFSLAAGKLSSPVKYGDSWAVIRTVKEEYREIGPFEKISMEVKENILNRKKERALEDWIFGLRKEALIKVDRKLLKEIKIDGAK